MSEELSPQVKDALLVVEMAKNYLGTMKAVKNLTDVSTDLSTTGNLAATLKKDSTGAIYLSTNSSTLPIYESSTDNASVNFDWTETWGGITTEATSYAIEGIDSNSDDEIDYYKLAVRHKTIDNADNSYFVNF